MLLLGVWDIYNIQFHRTLCVIHIPYVMKLIKSIYVLHPGSLYIPHIYIKIPFKVS